MEYSPQFRPDNIHDHHSLVSNQHRLYGSIQRHRVSRGFSHLGNLHHLVLCACPSPYAQRTAPSTPMDSRSLWYIHKYRSHRVPAGSLGFYLLPTFYSGHPEHNELELPYIRHCNDFCGRLLHGSWQAHLYTTCGTGEARSVKTSTEDSILKYFKKILLELLLVKGVVAEIPRESWQYVAESTFLARPNSYVIECFEQTWPC